MVLERDALPPAAATRTGTPRAHHVHGLLAGGLKALEQLLPGIEEDLLRAGAVSLNGSLEVRFERPGFDPYPARDLGVTTIAASCALIEFVQHGRVSRLPAVTLRSLCRAKSIQFAPDGASATGVRFEDADGRTHELHADLVIDATGRGSLTLDLLRAAGREVPQEGGRWLLSLGGRCNDKPPDDESGFFDFARCLRTSTIHDAIRGARRVGEVHRFAFPHRRWRHFDRVPDPRTPGRRFRPVPSLSRRRLASATVG